MLVVTPEPHQQESLLGYVLRVAESNGYTSFAPILSIAGYEDTQIRSSRFDWKPLAPILGGYDLSRHDYLYLSASLRKAVSGDAITDLHQVSGLWSLSSPKVCPTCIKQLGYIEQHWDAAHMIACPEHGTYALTVCERCGSSLKWGRPGLLECHCGADLRRCTLTKAPRTTLDLVEFLQRKFYGLSTSDTEFEKNNPAATFDDLSFYRLTRLFKVIARSFPCSGVPKFKFHNEAELFGRVFSNWPLSYHDYLESIGIYFEDVRGYQSSLIKQFAPYYGAIKDGRRYGTISDVLVSEFIKFGFTVYGKAFVDDRLLARVIGGVESRYVTPAQAGRLTGMSPVTLRKWAQKGIIDSKVCQSGTAKRVLLDINNTDVKKSESSDVVLTRRKAAKYVGIPVSIIKFLKHSGVYQQEHKSCERNGYHIKDIDLMVSKILELVSTCFENKYHTDDLYSFSYILTQKRFRSDSGKTEFLTDCLNQKISSVERTGNTLRDIFFLRTEIDAYIETQTRALAHEGVNQKDAAKIIEFPCDIPPLLYDQRYVDGHCYEGAGLRFDLGSLYTFCRQYVSINKLSKGSSVGIRKLIKYCRADDLNIRMYSVRRRKGQRCFFIESINQHRLLEYVRNLQHIERIKINEKAAIPTKREILENYFEELREEGKPLPRRFGKPNLKQIGLEVSGIGRHDFYIKDLKLALSDYDEEDRKRYNLLERDNQKQLRDYLKAKEVSGSKIPIVRGRPNKSRVAKECGFDRGYFSRDKEALDYLNKHFKKNAIHSSNA